MRMPILSAVFMFCAVVFAGTSDGIRIDVVRGEVSLGNKKYTEGQSFTAGPADIIGIPGSNTAIAVTIEGKVYQFVTDRPVSMSAAELAGSIRKTASQVKDRVKSENTAVIIAITVIILSIGALMALIFFISWRVGLMAERKRNQEYEKKLKPMVMSPELKKKYMGEYRK